MVCLLSSRVSLPELPGAVAGIWCLSGLKQRNTERTTDISHHLIGPWPSHFGFYMVLLRLLSESRFCIAPRA